MKNETVTLSQVLEAYDYAESHPHKYLRGTTNWCAAVAHALNAALAEPVPPAGGEPDALLYRRNDKPDRAWSVTNDPHYIESFQKDAEYETQPLFKPAAVPQQHKETIYDKGANTSGDGNNSGSALNGDSDLQRDVITVAWLDLSKLDTGSMAYATAMKVNHRQTELVDRDHVTRLQAELKTAVEACDDYGVRVVDLQAEVDILGKRVEEEVATSIANELKAEHERAALQTELTKAREFNKADRLAVSALQVELNKARSGVLGKYDSAGITAVVAALREDTAGGTNATMADLDMAADALEYLCVLAHQSAPAAKDGE